VTLEEKIQWVNAPPRWMYEFDLGDGVKTPLLTEELRSIHQTREQLIVPAIHEIFPEGLDGKHCLDVACNEGYFSHVLYKMGGLVKGIDIREANVARARRIRQILDYEPQRLNFEVQDLFDLANGAQSFDLILFLGILYHLENPIGALRLVHKRARRAVILETQLTRQAAPIVSGWGQTGVTLELEASLALYQETDAETNRLASKNCVSFIPNVAAVRQMLLSAGFTTVRQLPAAEGLNFQYVQNDRAVFVQFYRAS
jgi:tRNA (mo5U34)-methyltransferase